MMDFYGHVVFKMHEVMRDYKDEWPDHLKIMAIELMRSSVEIFRRRANDWEQWADNKEREMRTRK